ncbi:class I SAM-dependent methyltransferase [uncultured Prevotella sp.]|jgi:SAM-dependent methyltransferase|uniref:class I SAM-dependent methyltransferase n=1 Tax=uncultured Prevotella sp. TaxID=159272 RepID=UPI0027E2E45E|nr:class I SAM-dependent methyltransferase [uncultured Prevotella sp.]
MTYSQYDEIADKYDNIFRDERSLVENREVGDMLPPLSGSILDIGCGTGLLTEIHNVSPNDYLGIDPSIGMLSQFKAKHPEFSDKLINSPFTGRNLDSKKYDNIVALFGSPSYLSGYALIAISKSKAKKFLMFYKEDYHPVTYEKCKVEFRHNIYSKKVLAHLFGENSISEYHNYIIVNDYETERFKV